MKNDSFNNIISEKMDRVTFGSIGLACNLVSENYDNLPLLKHYPIDKIDLYYLRSQITLLAIKNRNEEKVEFNVISRDKDIIKKIAYYIVVFDYFDKGNKSMLVKDYARYKKETKGKYLVEDTYKPIYALIKLSKNY